ncbi:MAG: hypothetical protein QM638_01200 [Nocardioides sp.]|uniref:phage portal protein family protein n=1 Tax=Nocardioides sp. TaxID=35761 RepID=UPI0039E32447
MTESPVAPAELAPVTAPSRELGAAVTTTQTGWWDDLAAERVPELRWPAAYDVYDQMADNPQVSSVFQAVLMPILRTGWRIDGTGCDADVTAHVAGDLGLPILGQDKTPDTGNAEERFSWGEHLEVAGEEVLRYGHSFYEQKAAWGDDERWHLVKLGWRPGRTISKINIARDGGLVSLEQTLISSLVTGTPGPVRLPVGRVVAYVRGRKGGNWRGRSLLRPAYTPWLLNNRAMRVEMTLIERAGSPLYVYEAAENEKDLSAGKTIATEARSGQSAGAAIPNGASLEPKGYTGTLPDVDKVKRYNDEQIARAVLAHFLNLGTMTGSWALGSTFADFFTLSLQAVAGDIARTASRHIIRDLVHWNWPGARAPRLVFDEIGSNQESIVAAIATLVGAGVLKPDEPLEQFIRTALGLPARGASAPLEETA